MKIVKESFGIEGAQLYTITNDQGMTLQISNLGARIVGLKVPVHGKERNLVLGFPTAEDYLEKDPYIGASIGRVAGRIKDAEAKIGDLVYHFDQNDHGNTLHGGANSFEVKLWETDIEEKEDEIQVRFTYVSADGENGFPGQLKAVVIYTLNNNNDWIIDYHAETDKETLYNPTNHVYFNLLGDPEKSVKEHVLQLNADKFAVINEHVLPTGELREVAGTPFDFSNPLGAALEQGFDTDYEQNRLVGGYDHPFVFTHMQGTKPQGFIQSPDGEVKVELYTDRPAVVVFTMNLGEKTIPVGREYIRDHSGVTLETQVLSGATEFADFGNIELKSENEFRSTTKFHVEWQK